MIPHYISKHFNNEEEIRAWATWALGCPEVRSNETAKFWNARHSDLLVLKEDDLIADTLPKMIELWRESTREG